MLLTESYKNRLKELAGIKPIKISPLLKEAEDLYANSNKRVKFDINVMKEAIEGGMEVGMIFQSDNDKYRMPIWKTRIVQPVVMGYDKKGQLVIRGIHVTGQSEKKAIETGKRSAEANNEWRLFKVSNIKSIFLTGRLFQSVSLPGYNPNDSAMNRIIAKFDPKEAIAIQAQLKKIKQTPIEPVVRPIAQPIVKPTTQPIVKPVAQKQASKGEKDLEKKIDKLNKLI